VPDIWSFGTGGYYKVDADTMTVSALFPYPLDLPTVQQGLKPITDGTYVYANSTNTDVTFRVEIATDTFTRTTVGDFPYMIADDGTTLWIANDTDNDVSRVDKATMVRGTDEAITNNGVLLWVDPYLWVFSAGATTAAFRVYDPVTDTVIHTGTIVSALSGINDAVYYDGHVYVPVRFHNRLYKIDASTYSTVSSVAFTQGENICAVGGYLYVTTGSSGNQDITKIDPADLSTVSTLTGTFDGVIHNYVDTLWTFENATHLTKVDLSTFTVTSSVAIPATNPDRFLYAASPPVPPTSGGWVVGAIGF